MLQGRERYGAAGERRDGARPVAPLQRFADDRAGRQRGAALQREAQDAAGFFPPASLRVAGLHRGQQCGGDEAAHERIAGLHADAGALHALPSGLSGVAVLRARRGAAALAAGLRRDGRAAFFLVALAAGAVSAAK